MFKLLFHRSAPLIRLLELIGVVNSFLFLRGKEIDILFWLYLFLLVAYLFIRICDTLRWYSKEETDRWEKRIGIRVHFHKVLVPTSYILAVVTTICLLRIGSLSLVILLLADICMSILISVNLILIWFHLNDKEELPINYFSLNRAASPDGRRDLSEAVASKAYEFATAEREHARPAKEGERCVSRRTAGKAAP